MERPLTSWKEIATHFNKSVRTVQRWEQQFGLPVRRPDAHNHGIVLAFPGELDTWLRTHLIVRPENGDAADAMAGLIPLIPETRTIALSCSLSEFRANREKHGLLIRQTRELINRVRTNFAELRKRFGRSESLHERFGAAHRQAMAISATRMGEERRPAKAGTAARAS